MYVVHVFNSGVVSGPETLVLPALAKAPFQVSVIFLTESRQGNRADSAPKYARGLGLHVTEIKVRSRHDKTSIMELSQFLQTHKTHIIHAHDVKASFYAYFARQALNNSLRAASPAALTEFCPKLCSTHHGAMARPDWKTRFFEKLYVRFILPRCDKVYAVSHFDAALLERRGVPKTRILAHLNGISRSPVVWDKRIEKQGQIRLLWKADSETFIMGIVGRLSKEKNHSRLMSILGHFKTMMHQPWQLFIIGDGPEMAHLEPLISKNNLAEHIKFLGYRENMSVEMTGLDLLVNVSLGEGLPITMLEAAWVSTPIFAPAVGGIPDFIRNHQDGILFKHSELDEHLAKRLKEMFMDRGSLESMARSLHERVQKDFSCDSWLNSLEKSYRECVADTQQRTT